MLQIARLFTLLLLLLIFFYKLNGLCDPCEEFTDCVFPYKHKYDVNSNNTSITVFTWKINENDVANCYTENIMECLTFEKNEKLINFTIQKEKGSLNVQAIVFNVSRYNSSIIPNSRLLLYANFRSKNIRQQLLYTCDLKLYAKIKGMECVTQKTTNGVLINCLSTKVYPPCTCVFNVTINKEQLYLKPTYNSIIESENPPYFRTECSVEVVQEQLVQGHLEYQVAMVQILSTDCYKSTPCYALQTFSSSLKIGSTAIICTTEKPYNCSNSCYTNDEFCHDGKIYPCHNASHVVTNVQEWCRNRNRKDEYQNQSLSCNTACKFHIITTHEENGSITNKQIAIIIGVGTALVLLVCGVIVYRKITLDRKLISASNANNRLYKTAAIGDLRDNCGDDREPFNNSQDTCSVNLTDETDPSVSTLDLLNPHKDFTGDSRDDCSDETYSTSSVTSQDSYSLKLTDGSDMSKHCSDERKSSTDKYVTISIKIPVDNVPSKSPMQETRSDDNCDNSLAENANQEGNNLVKTETNKALFDILRLQKDVLQTQCTAVSSDSPPKSLKKTSVLVKFAKEMPHGSVQFREAAVSIDTSILLLKQDLVDLYNIPAEDQLWYLKNKLMEDDTFLSDYEISESDAILIKAK